MGRRLHRVMRKKSAFKRGESRSGGHPHIKHTLEIWRLEMLEQHETSCCNLLELLHTRIGFEALENMTPIEVATAKSTMLGACMRHYGIPGSELAQRVGIEKKSLDAKRQLEK